MNREMYYGLIKDIIMEIADIPKEDISPEKSLLEDLELSSLEIFMMLGELESRIGMRISDEKLGDIVTIENLLNCLDVTKE